MSSEVGFAIRARGLSKRYTLYRRPSDRLLQMFLGRRRRVFSEFWALRDVDLELRPGEVVGVVGRNGAGKSTLLQLVCGTLTPTEGTIETRGRIAALLELGAGFNPEFTGRENVYLSASILGLAREEIDEKFDSIVRFSGIGEFIDRPVKTYSSGMFVRLAFSVATSVEPAILVVDEALSVGDGEFARKSFDRIMALRDSGRTILFCSHALYHIDAICGRALWLRDGRVEMDDVAGKVTAAYGASLEVPLAPLARRDTQAPSQVAPQTATPGASRGASQATASVDSADTPPEAAFPEPPPSAPEGTARIVAIEILADGAPGREVRLRSRHSTLEVRVRFASDPAIPAPSLAVCIESPNRVIVASAGSVNDGVALARDASGRGQAALTIPEVPLLKGRYALSVYLMCERGLHVYQDAQLCATLEVEQQGLEQGFVSIPHRWRSD